MYNAVKYARECGASREAVGLLMYAQYYNGAQTVLVDARDRWEGDPYARGYIDRCAEGAEASWQDFLDVLTSIRQDVDPAADYSLTRDGYIMTVEVEEWEYMV